MQQTKPQYTGTSVCMAKNTLILRGYISNKKIIQWLMWWKYDREWWWNDYHE